MTTTFGARAFGLAVSFVSLLAFACSSADKDPGSNFAPSGGETPNKLDASASGSSGSSGGGLLKSSDGGPGTGLGACASSATKGQQSPLDIFIMLDQSGSMNEDVATGGTKWDAITKALNAFVGSPQQNVSVGLQYFGLPAAGPACVDGSTCTVDADCNGGICEKNIHQCICVNAGKDSCNAATYATPDVEIAPLPGVAAKITASIAAHSPNTSTPTAPALQGAIDHASTWAKAHPNDVTIVVFATDGEPSECTPQDIPSIAQIAAAGVSAAPKILTFVIGVGSSTGNLDAIAQGGGTANAFVVDTNANAQQQFLDALNKIRGTALGCTYSIPVPEGGTPDFGAVNVQYTPAGATAPVTIPKVKDASACPASGEAWHYDDNAKPSQIVLCTPTCNTVSASKGEVDVVLGCATVVK